MKYLFILTFFITYIFFGLELGFTGPTPIWKHVTYMFQHGSIWHLLINSFSFFLMFRLLQRYIKSGHITVMILTAAFSMSFLCTYTRVVVGASGMVYAMLGMYFYLVSIRFIRFKNKMSLVLSVISVLTFLTISFFKHNSAGMLHLSCLLSGFTILAFYRIFTNNLTTSPLSSPSPKK